MKRLAVWGGLGVVLLVAGLCASAVANPDASCPADPNPLRLFPSTVDIACVPASSWGEWQGRSVLVTAGPYEGRAGVVQATSRDLVKVAFPPGTDGLWFRDGQLERVEEAIVSAE